MKPHIRPLWWLGYPLLWECRGRMRVSVLGWCYFGKRGHGFSREEAFEDWEAQHAKPQ